MNTLAQSQNDELIAKTKLCILELEKLSEELEIAIIRSKKLLRINYDQNVSFNNISKN